MAVSSSTVLRWSARLLAASFAVAVALGRICGPAPVLRSLEPARFASLPGPADDSVLSLLDLQSGAPVRVGLTAGDCLEEASGSPWRDESGGVQVAGRWRTRTARGTEGVTTGFGLARYSFPDGKCLDRVSTDVLPQGPPCWYPGTTAKVLFASADGGLYRFNFEGQPGPDTTEAGRDLRPIPIVWKVAPPGDDERSVRISDPVWPAERAFGGRVFVSLRVQTPGIQGGTNFEPPRPWWLKLDARGEAIEAAGPLDIDGMTLDTELKVRFPRPIRMKGGGLRLAMLARPGGGPEWALRIWELAQDADGTPRLVPGSDITTAEHCAHAPLAASPDGDWVYYVPLDAPTGWVLRAPTVRREGRSAVASAE